MSEIKYPLQSKMTIVEKLELANSLVGRQLRLTHYWCGKYYELDRSIVRTVQYISIDKCGAILIGFNDGAIPLSAYGDTAFDSQERADSELAYLKWRDGYI